MIAILKGDDTDFQDLRTVEVTLKQMPFALTDCKGDFTICGQTVTLDEIEAEKPLAIVFSHEQTSRMEYGKHYGTFRLIDALGRVKTIDSAIPVLVSDSAEEVYGIGSSVTLSVTTSYNALSDLPKINGVELRGNKTSKELKIEATYVADTPPDTVEGFAEGAMWFDRVARTLYVCTKVLGRTALEWTVAAGSTPESRSAAQTVADMTFDRMTDAQKTALLEKIVDYIKTKEGIQ